MFLATKFIIILLSLILTILPQSNCQFSGQNETKYSVCRKPFNCGSLSSISYPFSGNNSPSYCGIFNLKCGPPSQYVSIQISSQIFEVMDINTETNNMALVRQNQINDVCSRNLTNVSLSTSLFSYTETVASVTVFYDCPPGASIGENNFTCQNDGSFNAFYVDVSETLFHQFSDLNKCKSSTLIEAPAMKGNTLDPNSGIEAYLKSALNGAFEVNYFAGGAECTRCQEGGGICGTSDVSRDQFSCFCRDTSKDCGSLHKDSVEKMGHDSNKKKILIGVIVGCVILAMLILVFYKRMERRRRRKRVKCFQDDMNGETELEVKLQKFDFRTIANATGNFSSDNKLGEGGFGSVYKGTLMSGKDIAVKRLSLKSRQGMNELITEVNTIAQLQHRNLVQLLGCCLANEEKMLVYEYLPNKSLDFFIFDQTRSKLLNWEKRMHIIVRIAHGLLYLHQDSRMRIIHRDLKASNILLDENMNPKISDFGLAKAVQEDQTEAMTNKIVGTYGYMPPEYVMRGQVSIKLDVFSFGVLVLEMLSGRKNRALIDPDHQLNLLGHCWRLWVENRHLELVDDSFGNTADATEVLRCMHVALLCVQPRPQDRPDMTSVVVMLTTDDNDNLPRPNQPEFYVEWNLHHEDLSAAANQRPCSENKVSISFLEART